MSNDPLRNFDIHRYFLHLFTSAALWAIDTRIASVDKTAQLADAEGELYRRFRAMIAPLAPSVAGGVEDVPDEAPGDDEVEDARTMLACTALDALAEGDMLGFVRAAMAYDSRIDLTGARQQPETPQPEPTPAPVTPSAPQQPVAAPDEAARAVDPEAPTQPAPPRPSP